MKTPPPNDGLVWYQLNGEWLPGLIENRRLIPLLPIWPYPLEEFTGSITEPKSRPK